MGVFHRKLFRPSNGTFIYPCLDCSMTKCPPECNLGDGDDDDDDDDAPPPYPPPLPPLPPVILPLHPALDRSSDQYENPNPDQKHQVSPIVIIIIVILASCFLLVSYYAIIVKFCGSWRESRRRRRRRDSQNQPPEETHEDFIDENHGPIVDHPIWFITTVGLEQSIINAITVCKYKKGEGLIEGTECSVCLNEFHEDETLRLLPKCSHAFHLPCIDTWLRSHKNCPLCRAPIVSNPVTVRATSTAVVPVSNSSDSREATIVENSESDDGLEVNQQMVSESRIGVEDERELELQGSRSDINITKEIVPCPPPNNGFRGLSDLGDNHRTSVENGVQPVRRSVSMDLSMFCLSVPSSVPGEGGSSNAEPVVGKDSNSSIVLKSPSGSASIFRLMGSSSIGGFLQRGPVSMKRSFSNGEKLSRSRRSQSSNLPL